MQHIQYKPTYSLLSSLPSTARPERLGLPVKARRRGRKKKKSPKRSQNGKRKIVVEGEKEEDWEMGRRAVNGERG